MAAAVLIGNAGAVAYVWSRLAIRKRASAWLSLPLAFSLVEVFGLVCMVAVLTALKLNRQRLETRRHELSGTIRQLLAGLASGEIPDAADRIQRQDRTVTAGLILEFLSAFRGEQRTRLMELAERLGFGPLWERQSRSRRAEIRRRGVDGLAALGTPKALACLRERSVDKDPSVRLTAIRRLTSAGKLDASTAFHFALDESLHTRALVAEDLRPRATELCSFAVPEILASGDRERTLAALDMVRSWRRIVILPQLDGLRWENDRDLALAVIAIVPYLGDPAQQEQSVLKALEHKDPAVRSAAAAAGGQLGLRDFTGRLALMLHDSDSNAAREAAAALAKLGPDTWPILEREVLCGSPRAGIAVEALELAQTSRWNA
jgi:HEAT repeat protein